jgi:S-methylmethionine-dependent homocysteine/selenocysteine methylase
MTTSLPDLLASGTRVLGDCAAGTRLHLESPLPTDDDLGLVPLLDDAFGVAAIRSVVAGYAATAAELGLPILVDTPTWWARPDRLAVVGITGDAAREVVRHGVAVVDELKARYPSLYTLAPIGPSTDGYRAETVDARTARELHEWQSACIHGTGVDLVVAATFANADDLAIAAEVLAAGDLPFVLGPTVDDRGCLPDGTYLPELIDRIDAATTRPALHWALWCTHPGVAQRALERMGTTHPDAHRRSRQLKGNGSAASADEKDAADMVLCDAPEPWAVTSIEVLRDHDLQIVGGCCGTDHRHLLSLAVRLAAP